MIPTPRQADFLALDCQEALYGGAAGSAKTEALLMWLAEGIQVKGYSGIIFRRVYPQLFHSLDGIIAKSKRMFPRLGGKWNGTQMQWRFPAGSVIEMGHLQYSLSVDNYQGSSYHRVAFDELSQFLEYQYVYLIGRIRRTKNFPIELGIRAASNPGGIGHAWVRQRFVSDQAMDFVSGLGLDEPTPPGKVFWQDQRAFVPARLIDNPHIDREDYAQKLAEYPPVLRAQMLAGDWRVREDGPIEQGWFRFWEPRGELYRLLDRDGSLLKVIEPGE